MTDLLLYMAVVYVPFAVILAILIRVFGRIDDPVESLEAELKEGYLGLTTFDGRPLTRADTIDSKAVGLDYDDPKLPLSHKIAAREQGIVEEPKELGRAEYTVYKDGYVYRLVDKKRKKHG